MPHVETLRGPVDTAQLGFTLMHEHVFVLAEGGQTIVDLTVLGLARDIPRLRRAVGDVPLNVIVATGLYLYTDEELPRFFRSRDADVMADLFARDIPEGI